MKPTVLHLRYILNKSFVLIISLLFSTGLSAQSSDIHHYSIFSGNSSNINGVSISDGSTIQGSIASKSVVQTDGAIIIEGDILSQGQIKLDNLTEVNGTIEARNRVNPLENTPQSILIGDGVHIAGDVKSRGDVLADGTGIIEGEVSLPNSATYTGPIPDLGINQGWPNFTALPALPPSRAFDPVGTQQITTSQTITPGAYKKVLLDGAESLTFDGPGDYTFKTIRSWGETNEFNFDFQNDPEGEFNINVHKDVNLGRIRVNIINGGDASRINMEVHGSGSTLFDGEHSVIMKNGWNGAHNESSWQGNIYATNGGIMLGKGNGHSEVTGSIWSGSQVTIGSNVNLMMASLPPVVICELEASAGEDTLLNCYEPVIMLDGSGSTPDMEYLWTSHDDGNIVSGATTLTPVVDTAGTYVLTVTDPGDADCFVRDTVLVTEDFMAPDADAGEDLEIFCDTWNAELYGSSSTPNVEVVWSSPDKVEFDYLYMDDYGIEVYEEGTYVFTVTSLDNGCVATDTAHVFEVPYIVEAGEDVYLPCDEGGIELEAFAFNLEDPEPTFCFMWYSEIDGPPPYCEGGDNTFIAYSPGTYYVEAFSGKGGCEAIDSLMVFEPIIPYADAGPDVDLNCYNPETLVLDGTASTPGLEYTWTTDDGNIVSGGDGLSPTIDSEGEYFLEVYNEENGCSDDAEMYVGEDFDEPYSYAGEDVDLGCLTGEVELEGESEAIPRSSTIGMRQSSESQVVEWSTLDGDFESTEDPYVIIALSPGIYTFTVTDEENGCSSSSDVEVFTAFDPNVDAGPDVTLDCYGFTYVFGSSNYKEACYIWSSIDEGDYYQGGSCSAGVSIYDPGTYVLTVTGDDEECISSDTLEVFPFTGLDGASAGPPKVLNCFSTQVTLEGSYEGENGNFYWDTDDGNIVSGMFSPNPVVDEPGTYFLEVCEGGGKKSQRGGGGCCSYDEVVVVTGPCIIPYYPPLPEGKTDDKIGSELTSLYLNFNQETDTVKNIFRIMQDSVWIEVITIEGFTQDVMDLLVQDPLYGMTDFVPNGLNPLILTGKYPIENLNNLNMEPIGPMVNYVRPVFEAVKSSGVAVTQGDMAQRSDVARTAFSLDGSGVKVCVLSDSYNTVLGDDATENVLNGDLPGPGSPGSQVPVDIIQEYPYGSASDEGRAMLQIVHDVAPGAELGFRTGVISEGDLAMGVIESAAEGCDILVDDISFLTSPYFQDGVIARAVEQVSSQGVAYFVAAGNFAENSYKATFNPIPAPEGFEGMAHDFGGGDVMQSIDLAPGTYTIVLQWQDSIYSLGQTGTGTTNDFDIYLANEIGSEYFGFNRNNSGGDPFEVLPFTVPGDQTVTANFLITRASGTQPADIKLVAFRGELDFNEFEQGTATIVGQANADAAITLGAVNYFNTPAFGVSPPELAVFSSSGGTMINNGFRSKPDLLAPNGGNTTVFLGTPSTDMDPFPNFFGTSAAAPHAAAVGALLKEAKQTFYSEVMAPAEMKSLLTSTALDMLLPGFDFQTGHGLLQADLAILELASAKPILISIALQDSSIFPGTEPLAIDVTGQFFGEDSQIILGEDTLSTAFVSSTALIGDVPPFIGNPPLYVYTPPSTPSGLDGGNSNELFFFGDEQFDVVVTADDKQKFFGEALPQFTASITVNGTDLEDSPYSLETLGIASVDFNSPANSMINSGIYFIEPVITLADEAFNEIFDYETVNGLMVIDKLPLTILPRDKTVEYGDKIEGREFEFDYLYDESNIPEDEREDFLSALEAEHLSNMTNAVGLIDEDVLIDGRGLVREDLLNLAFLSTQRAVVSSRPMITQRPVVSDFVYDTTLVVDVSPASLFAYQIDDANGSLFAAGPQLSTQRAVVSQRPVVSGLAFIDQRPVVSGSSVVNSASSGDTGASDIVIIFDEGDANAPPNDTIEVFQSINVITSTNVGDHYIASAALLTANFELLLDVGDLIIEPAPLTITLDDVIVPRGVDPEYTFTVDGYKFGDTLSDIFDSEFQFIILDDQDDEVSIEGIATGTYSIHIDDDELNQLEPLNYNIQIIPAVLTVLPDTLIVTADRSCTDQFFEPEILFTIEGYDGNINNIIFDGPDYFLSDALGTEYYPENLQWNNIGLQPGMYQINPTGLFLVPGFTFEIVYEPGELYVNPLGESAQDISVWTHCIQELEEPFDEYTWEVEFKYHNYNPITLCVPHGSENFLDSDQPFSGSPPTLFPPGEGSFTVYYNNDPLNWTLRTYEDWTLNSNVAYAGPFIVSCVPVIDPENKSLEDAYRPRFSLTPNPARDFLKIEAENPEEEIRAIQVMDMLGNLQVIRVIFDSRTGVAQVDMSQLEHGIYLVRIVTTNGENVLRVIKE